MKKKITGSKKIHHPTQVESSKKKKKKGNITDRISSLPDDVAHHILSCLLYDAKSRVRASVLSKRWFALTASFPVLHFHLNYAWCWSFSSKYEFEDKVDKFCEYVAYTCDRNTSAHTLDICADFSGPEFLELLGRCLGRCLEFVIEKGLQVLVIGFRSIFWMEPMFHLPSTVLSASSLTSLTLRDCKLSMSLMDHDVKLNSLRLLWLSKIMIDEGVIEYLTRGCPLLEEICLHLCSGSKTFCIKEHHNLQKVKIYYSELAIIDVDAPNLDYFFFSRYGMRTGKAPSLCLDSCKKLTTFCYSGFPLKRFNDLLSNFPIMESVCLDLSSPLDNLKLSHHVLRSLELRSSCDLEEIDLNTPGLRLFVYDNYSCCGDAPTLYRKHPSMSKGCMKCVARGSHDMLWYLKLRKFLEKNSIFKVLKLALNSEKFMDFEELKLIESPPYELDHVELIHSFSIGDLWVHVAAAVAAVDAVLWCCRPRSLTLELYHYMDTGQVVKYAYKKLLQQEDEGQTNIKFVLISYLKDEQHFSDLNSLLKRLSLDRVTRSRFFDRRKSIITFIKEKVVQEAG